MSMTMFFCRSAVYLAAFAAAWYGLSALHYEKFLRGSHVRQAQVLYVMMAMALAWMAGSFILEFIYR